MSDFINAKETREEVFLRLGLVGPSGAGKTWTGLTLAAYLAGPDGRVAGIDSERGSMLRYKHDFDFFHCRLNEYDPRTYIAKMRAAEAQGFKVLFIDSLTHAWTGKNGALDQVDKIAARSQSKNSFAAWREVTPLHNDLVDTILDLRMHVIVTLRAKTEYVMEEVVGKNNKTYSQPKKVGMAPIQRDGLEYEFDIVGEMTVENKLLVGKTRCKALARTVWDRPGADFGEVIKTWLSVGNAGVIPTAVQTVGEEAATDESLARTQDMAKAAETIDALSVVRLRLEELGGAYWNLQTRAILRDRYNAIKAAQPLQEAA